MFYSFSRYYLSKNKLENDNDEILLKEIDEGKKILDELYKQIKNYDSEYQKFQENLKVLVNKYQDYYNYLVNHLHFETKLVRKFFSDKYTLKITSPKNVIENLYSKRKIFLDWQIKTYNDSTNIIDSTYDADEKFFSYEDFEYKSLSEDIFDKLKLYNEDKFILVCEHYEISDFFSNLKPFIRYNISEEDYKIFCKLKKIDGAFYNSSDTGVISKKKFIEIKNRRIEKGKKYLRKRELIIRSRKSRKEKDENIGYVYVLSNKAYPNIYKIGSTYNLPEERAEELTGTGHLTPFKVEYNIEIKSAEYFEKLAHEIFAINRVDKNREFFEINLNEIKNKLNLIKKLSNNGEVKLTSKELF